MKCHQKFKPGTKTSSSKNKPLLGSCLRNHSLMGLMRLNLKTQLSTIIGTMSTYVSVLFAWCMIFGKEDIHAFKASKSIHHFAFTEYKIEMPLKGKKIPTIVSINTLPNSMIKLILSPQNLRMEP